MDVKPFGKYAKAMICIRWFMKARTIDQLDSPILYSFYNQVVKPKLSKALFADIEKLRQSYLSNKEVIAITDYGAGSSTSNSKKRSISSIASSAVSGTSKCHLLYKICQHFKAQNILELGTSLGISAIYMTRASHKSKLTTLEGDPAIGKIALPHLEKENINGIIGTFATSLDQLFKEQQRYDLVYLDGGHRSDLLLDALARLQMVTTSKSILIVDDIYWSKDMTQAWDKLKSSGDYNVAIDLWHFGILYQDERAKETIDVKMSPINRRWTFGFFR